MRYTIVTQTRGDGGRIAEWIDYHHALGFDDFQIILDGVVDDTPDVLASSDSPAHVSVYPYPEEGEYHDRLDLGERRRRLAAWREENAEWRATLPHSAFDPQSVRQIERIGEVMAPYHAGERGKGWVAHIDVDEFIHLAAHAQIGELLAEASAPRVRIHSLDVDTSGHDPARPVLEQHRRTWSRQDLEAHPQQAWANRVKTIARYRRCLPMTSIHKISRGRHQLVDPAVAHLHHYRIPMHDLDPPLAYTVDDPLEMPPRRPG